MRPSTKVHKLKIVHKQNLNDAELIDYYFDKLQGLLISYWQANEDSEPEALQYAIKHTKDSFWWWRHWWEDDL